MNDFEGLFSSDYGFKPQGKTAPLAPAKSDSRFNSTFNYDTGGGPEQSSSGSFLDDDDILFRSSSSGNRKTQEFSNLGGFDEMFGGAANSKSKGDPTGNLNSIFDGRAADSGSKFSSLPVFDKPVYDDEVFQGSSSSKSSSSSSTKHDDMFTSSSSSKKKEDAFDDLLGGFGLKEPEPRTSASRGAEKGSSHFDDLLPGFGGSPGTSDRSSSGSNWAQNAAPKKPSNAVDDPFVVLDSTSPTASSPAGIYNDPLEQFSKMSVSSTKKPESTSVSGRVFDDIDPLSGFANSIPMSSSNKNDKGKDRSPARVSSTVSKTDKYSVGSPELGPEKKMSVDNYQKSSHEVFNMPSVSAASHRSVPNASSPPYVNIGFDEANCQSDLSPKSADNADLCEEIWLTVSEVPLFTEPTNAPPPSRPPPPRPVRSLKEGAGSYAHPYAKKKVDDYSPFSNSSTSFQSPNSGSAGLDTFASPIDELEEFVTGRSQVFSVGNKTSFPSAEDTEANSDAAAAMKEAMEKAEAKFRHAKGLREREYAKATRMHHERGQMSDVQEREYREGQQRLEHERQHKESEEEERRMKEEEEHWRIEKLREEKEREKRRREREREQARQAVERATREARERAAVEARARAEKAAVEKAQAEARQRAERAAVQRAQGEARERAARTAAEAKEKAEREAREKVKAEAKEKEARERAAAAAKASQQKNENDLDSFFGMGSRASSVPRPSASYSDPFNAQFQNKQTSEATRASVNATSNMRKVSSSASIVDDLSSIFGAAPSAGEFQEVEGETEDRRRARLERNQRTQERAAKALAEKNQRDLEAQREQVERHRIAETLDVEIRRWSTGKEGNLRALLSTLQYVLWPECGWQPVSLTDLINGASVKKAYRKATLCIHPDKVQQKGANLQQKYIAEKVFDLLKEAWNKFNSEELF